MRNLPQSPEPMDCIKLNLPISSPHSPLSPPSLSLLSRSFSFLVPTTPWVSPLMSFICDGSSDEDVDCNCTGFFPKRTKSSRCKHCDHRQASHSNPVPIRSREHPTMATTQQDHNKYVDRLMRSLDASAVHDEARRETLRGFRPTPSASVSSQSFYSTID